MLKRCSALMMMVLCAACVSLPDYGPNIKPQAELQSNKSFSELMQCNSKWMKYWLGLNQTPIENGYAFTDPDLAITVTLTDAGSVRIVRIFKGKSIDIANSIFGSKDSLISRFAQCV